MRVVFLEDVPNIARAGEIKEVTNGYGRNFLIPRKLAVPANPHVVNLAEIQRKVETRRQAEERGQLATLAKQLEGKEITLKARAGSKGKLYGSITDADIASELENSAGLVVDERKIEFEPIHELGSYEVTVRLGKDLVPKIKVTVIEEEAKTE